MSTQAHTVTIAQALASSANALAVLDSAANIAAALPNAGLVGRVASFTVSAPAVLTAAQLLSLAGLGSVLHASAGALQLNSAATVSVAQLTALEAMPGFSLGSAASLTLSDSTAQIVGLLGAHPAWFAQLAGVSVHLDGTAIGAYPATQLNGLAVHGKALTFVASPGHTVLAIAAAAHDLGSNAAALDALAARQPLAVTVTNDGAAVTAADAAGLATLQGFNPSAHTLYVSDTAANIAAHAGLIFGHGFAQIQVVSGNLAGTAARLADPTLHFLAGAHAQLAASATLGGSAAAALAALPGFSLAAGATLAVADTAATLVATAPGWMAYASAATLTAGATVTAATATSLAQIAATLGAGFSLNGNGLVVSDTLSALLALPAQAASLATGLSLAADATAIVAQATAFAALPHVTLGGHAISVTDSAANLLGLAGAALADTAHESLSADATVSAAAFSALRSLPNFSLGGHVLTVADSAANLAGLAGMATLAGATVLAADAQVGAGQLALASLPGFSLGGHVLSVTGAAADLLGLSPAALALAGSVTLSADATLTAAQAATLVAEPGFSLGGHHLTVADSEANLAALSPAVLAFVGAEQLTMSATVSAAVAATLAAEPGFSVAAGATLTVADTLPALLALPPQVTAVIGAMVLSGNATASAAQITAFTALPHATTGGFAIAVTDTAANLLGLSGAALADAGATALSADATVSAAGFTALRGLPNFGLNGHGLTVTDTAANLLALSGPLGQIGATQLSTDGQVNAGQLTALAALPGFATHGHVLSLVDTAANLLALPPAIAAAATTATLSADATLSVAQAAALTQLPGFFLGGHHIAILDTAANLLTGPAAWHAVANAVTLSADATVSATGAATLAQIAGTLGGAFSLGGHALVVTDSLASLLALPAQADNLATALSLNANATATAAQVAAFAALPHASLGGFSIAVVDTAANLTGLSGAALADAATTGLYADATVGVAQLAALAALPGFSTNGHVLSLVDTAAALLALPPALAAMAGSVTLSADATVTAAQAQMLMTEPAFSAGAHHLTVADTAANLLALPQAVQLAAGTLALSADQVVNAVQLAQLAALGIKFTEAGHLLTCLENAAGLAALTPGEVALTSAQMLGAPATVSAATALVLAALPHLTTVPGAILTVQDSLANLLAMGAGAPAATSVVQLPPGSTVIITATQGQALAAIPHFIVGSTAITVADTVADLMAAATAGWQSVAGSVHVLDSAANLAAAAGTALVQAASAVTLSGNGQVSAAAAVQIAAIPHFGAGVYSLAVADTAAAIAAHAAAIIAVATGAVVTDSGPIATAAADQLASVSAAGLLSFQGGDQLLVQDSYAALTNPANAAGVALAARIGVADSAANLVSAAGHDWGALNPSYSLTQSGVISAAQAQTLAGLGGHFAAAGYTLSVADAAAPVAASAAALAALGITATVSDTVANLNAQASSLVSMGAEIAHVTVTDTGSVSAAAAAGLAGLAGKLSGVAVHVADTAADVDNALPGLSALGLHAAVMVTDSAANVAAVAADLASLHATLRVALTDSAPVTAATASALAPLAANLATPPLAVSDTGAAVAAHAPALLALGAELGSISLADGSTQTVAVAAALAPLDAHLAPGVMLTATGTAAAVDANLAGLTALLADSRLAGVTVANTSVADVAAHAAALNTLPATVSISDSAAHVDAGLAALSGIAGLSGIALTDSGTPALSVTIAMLAADSGVLARITTPFSITVADTAADIAADLASGPASVIAAHLPIGAIVATDGLPVLLTQAQALAAGVDDGAGSALAAFAGALDVSGVDVAHVAQVAGLGHAPAAIAVSDTAAAIAADLAQGNASALLNAGATVTRIDVADHAPIVLTAAQVLQPGIDDGAGSVLARLHGAVLDVVGASIAQLASLSGLGVLPAGIAVSDTAADIAADLASGSSALVGGLAHIGSITVSDGGVVSLTEAQLLAASVDDGAGSVLARMTGGSLAVTGVAAGDLAQVLALGVPPASIAIADTAAHLVSNLATVVADIGVISAISVTGPAPTLTAGEALAAHVDDGAGSVIDRLSGHAFNVSGASVTQLGQLVQLQDAPGTIGVSDSSGQIVADLMSGASTLAADIGSIGTITVTHGTLALTDAQAETILGNSNMDAVFAKLAPATVVAVSGVPLADLSGIAGAGWPHVTVAVADTAAAIAADIASGNSVLAANMAAVSGVTLDAGGTVDAATLTRMAGLPAFSTGGCALDVQDGAAAIAGLGQAAAGFAHAVLVADTDSNVTGQLDALQARYAGALSITLTNNAPGINVSAAQYAADAATIDAITNPAVVGVSGSAGALAGLAAQLGSDAVVGSVSVTDAAANVIANLAGLQAAGGKLAVVLTDTSLAANLIAPLLTIANLSPGGIPVADIGSQIAAVVETGNPAAIAYLNANGATLSADSAITATDAAALESLSGFSKAGHLLEVWDTASHLTTPGYAAALASSAIDGVHLKTAGGVASVTAATAASLFNIAGFVTANPDGSPNTLNVTDTAAHIDANLAALTTNRSSIGNIAVNASATVSDQTLGDLQGLGATAAAGVGLTVRDTAATIANNAPAQTGLHSIWPAGWTLSGNGLVSEAQAALLGNLAHFSTGGYIVTLNLSGDTVISLADAQALGNIAGALNLAGHHLVVDGTVAELSGLSPAALGLVTPALADSFANIAALPASSALLTGTVEVTGADSLSAADVAGFLALVHTGAGQGIAASGLTFDSSHYVNDSVANLRSLTSGAGWTGNAATHADFTLVGRDTVANLINPANTGFLSGLAVTALAANATVSAAAATALNNISASIHFQHDHLIVVQDTASGLLNPAYSGGLGLADRVQLAGPATVDAADAESLLSISHMALNTALTISDSSANLLDGTLSGAITGSGFGAEISVQLAGPETLDADTAESLVSLPGFADTTNLTIADSAAYLLHGANLSAEQMAASVTLAGDEMVSANTVLRLSELPHFTPGASHLVLAGNDFADAATLKAIADDGGAFQANGHTVTLTHDVLNLTASEYCALQSDHVVTNGHAMGITPGQASVTDTANMLTVSAAGIAGGTVHVYGADGALLQSSSAAQAGFTVSVADAGGGHNYALTETVGGTEGAPLVVLDAAGLESAAAGAGASFASSGQIQVDAGKFVNLYEAGSVPALTHAALVYDPVAHTVSLDTPGAAPITLITLGGGTHPGSLDLSEILIKHHG